MSPPRGRSSRHSLGWGQRPDRRPRRRHAPRDRLPRWRSVRGHSRRRSTLESRQPRTGHQLLVVRGGRRGMTARAVAVFSIPVRCPPDRNRSSTSRTRTMGNPSGPDRRCEVQFLCWFASSALAVYDRGRPSSFRKGSSFRTDTLRECDDRLPYPGGSSRLAVRRDLVLLQRSVLATDLERINRMPRYRISFRTSSPKSRARAAIREERRWIPRARAEKPQVSANLKIQVAPPRSGR